MAKNDFRDEKVQKQTVVVKVEPSVVPQQFQPKAVFARPSKIFGAFFENLTFLDDIVSQAWNTSVVSTAMDNRGRIFKRTPAQTKAEERKIRNRQSASQRYF